MAETTTGFKPPRWLLLVLALAFVGIYTYGLTSRPLKWEEPRRCLIAMEMIERGDYVVPHLYGRPYFNKPPMQNWLIVLLAGNDFEAVGAGAVRGVTWLALLGTALLLWRLGSGRGPSVLPAIVLLTFGTIVQHGWAGELDVLFAFWITAALAAFEFGRRRGSPWLQWTLSQALVAGGVLTKGFAPLFFYPPVLWLAWRRDDVRFSPPAFVAGVLALVALVGAWAAPYAVNGPVGELVAQLTDQLSERTVDQGSSSLLLHVATYPLLVFGVLLPWSVVLFGHTPRRWRDALRAVAADPLPALALTTVAWAVLVYGFVPGGRGRYLIPLLPWAALLVARLLESTAPADDAAARRGDRAFRIYTGVMAVLWVGYAAGIARRDLAGGPLVVMAIVGLAVIAALAFARYRGALRNTTAALVMLGLLYGIGYRAVSEEREARRSGPFADAGAALGADIAPGTPVIIHEEVDRRTTYALGHAAGRTPRDTPPAFGPFVWIAPDEIAGPAGATRLDSAGRYVKWLVSDAMMLDKRATRPDLTPTARERLADQRQLARRRYEKRPDDLDALLLFARLTAEIGDDATAVTLYSRGLESRPDDPRFLRHRGESRIRLRRLDEAIADLERATDGLANGEDRFDGLPDEDPGAASRSPVQRALDSALDEPDDGPAPERPDESLRRNTQFHLAFAYYLTAAFEQASAGWSELLRQRPDDDESRYWAALAACRGGADAQAPPATDAIAARYADAIGRLCASDGKGAAELLRRLVENAGLARRREALAARVDLDRL